MATGAKKASAAQILETQALHEATRAAPSEHSLWAHWTGQAPQSPGQRAQVSPLSQAPLPQHEPQSAAQEPQFSPSLHLPSPQTGMMQEKRLAYG